MSYAIRYFLGNFDITEVLADMTSLSTDSKTLYAD